jgi:hypothetical protein
LDHSELSLEPELIELRVDFGNPAVDNAKEGYPADMASGLFAYTHVFPLTQLWMDDRPHGS